MVQIRRNEEDGGQVAFKCVVANDHAGQYAVYIGPTDWTDDEVCGDGQKLRSKAGMAIAHDLQFLDHQWYNRTYRL